MDVETDKDLGVILHNSLKASNHCCNAYSKAVRMLGLINRTIVNKTPSVMLQLYKALVRPQVEYCTSVWNPYYMKDKELIEKVQHRFTKMIPLLKEKSYQDRIRYLGLWTLEERRNRADLIEVYKILNGLTTVSARTFFEINITGRTRGHSLKLVKNSVRSSARQHVFSQRIINRWNALDEDTVSSESLNTFKNKLAEIRKTRMGFFTDSGLLGLNTTPVVFE